eukprot:1447605-Prymnesium_polylepis.1
MRRCGTGRGRHDYHRIVPEEPRRHPGGRHAPDHTAHTTTATTTTSRASQSRKRRSLRARHPAHPSSPRGRRERAHHLRVKGDGQLGNLVDRVAPLGRLARGGARDLRALHRLVPPELHHHVERAAVR